MAFELNQVGIGMKIVEPGGMKTDFFTRSLDVGRHPAYDTLLDRVMGAITDPKQMETYSTPEQIAEVVYEAATDGGINFGMSPGPMPKPLMRCACSSAMKRSAGRSGSSFSVSRPAPESVVLRTRVRPAGFPKRSARSTGRTPTLRGAGQPLQARQPFVYREFTERLARHPQLGRVPVDVAVRPRAVSIRTAIRWK